MLNINEKYQSSYKVSDGKAVREKVFDVVSDIALPLNDVIEIFKASIETEYSSVEVEEIDSSLGNVWLARATWTTDNTIDAPVEPYISSFSTTGGTAHIETAINVKRYNVGGIAPISWNKINFDGQNVLGCDINVPDKRFEIKKSFLNVASTLNYFNVINTYTGTVNDDMFFGNPPGSVLFEGFNGSLAQRKTDTEDGTEDGTAIQYYWDCSFVFRHSFNGVVMRNGSVIPAVNGDVVVASPIAIPKDGWDYTWDFDEIIEKDGRLETKTIGTYVAQVYPRASFKKLLGF